MLSELYGAIYSRLSIIDISVTGVINAVDNACIKAIGSSVVNSPVLTISDSAIALPKAMDVAIGLAQDIS